MAKPAPVRRATGRKAVDITKKNNSQSISSKHTMEGPSIRDEWGNVLLLVVLYLVQGIPLGLSMGSMPFLMRSNMSYTKIGIFTLTGYPYSFKLLWSPIVDSIYHRRIGRRKSWILPLQACSALLMIVYGPWVEGRLLSGDAVGVTGMFFVLVLLAATQDIAVDGWALTLLSKNNVGYASTCQTVGMNIGYFASFTVFLALNDPSFCNKYLRSAAQQSPIGIATLAGYLSVCGWLLLLLTVVVGLFKSEGSNASEYDDLKKVESNSNGVENYQGDLNTHAAEENNGNTVRRRSSRIAAAKNPNKSVKSADKSSEKSTPAWRTELVLSYTQLFKVVKLPAVRLLAVVLVVCRIGMLPAESAAALKLLEKGVSKEALAGLVLVEFPVELISALVAGQWAARNSPLNAWLFGYKVRLFLAGCTTAVVAYFPAGVGAISEAPRAFLALAAVGVMSSFASTLMFTAMGSFYNKISDPSMGGSYLTLLNTLANVGVVVPKLAVFAAIDWLTVKQCVSTKNGSVLTNIAHSVCGSSSSSGSAESNACVAAGGTCVMLRDGFYVLSVCSIVVGFLMTAWLNKALPKLDTLPPSAWRAKLTK